MCTHTMNIISICIVCFSSSFFFLFLLTHCAMWSVLIEKNEINSFQDISMWPIPYQCLNWMVHFSQQSQSKRMREKKNHKFNCSARNRQNMRVSHTRMFENHFFFYEILVVFLTCLNSYQLVYSIKNMNTI